MVVLRSAEAEEQPGVHPVPQQSIAPVREQPNAAFVDAQIVRRGPEASGAMVGGEFESAEPSRAEKEGYLALRRPLEAVQHHALPAWRLLWSPNRGQ